MVRCFGWLLRGGVYCTSFATQYLKLSQCRTDLATNKIDSWHPPPCHLSNSMNTSKATYGSFRRLGRSMSLQPVRPSNDLNPWTLSLLWLPQFFTWTPTLAIENRIYLIYNLYDIRCCTVRLNLQDLRLRYFPSESARPYHWARAIKLSIAGFRHQCQRRGAIFVATDWWMVGFQYEGVATLLATLVTRRYKWQLCVSVRVLLLGFNNS